MKTIVVVDDTPDNITFLAGLLKDKYRVKIATNGEQALELIRAAPPDLVLLDIMMPGINGFDVYKELQASPETSDVPVIFLSAMSQLEEIEFGKALGCSDYITKPIDPLQLELTILHVLGSRRGS